MLRRLIVVVELSFLVRVALRSLHHLEGMIIPTSPPPRVSNTHTNISPPLQQQQQAPPPWYHQNHRSLIRRSFCQPMEPQVHKQSPPSPSSASTSRDHNNGSIRSKLSPPRAKEQSHPTLASAASIAAMATAAVPPSLKTTTARAEATVVDRHRQNIPSKLIHTIT